MARNQERASGGIYREHGPQGSRYLVYPRDSEVPQHTNVLPKLQMFVDSRYWSDVVIFFRAIPFLVEAPLALGDLMRRRSATVLASLTLLVLSLSSPAHAAGSGTGMTEHGSVTYTITDSGPTLAYPTPDLQALRDFVDVLGPHVHARLDFYAALEACAPQTAAIIWGECEFEASDEWEKPMTDNIAPLVRTFQAVINSQLPQE